MKKTERNDNANSKRPKKCKSDEEMYERLLRHHTNPPEAIEQIARFIQWVEALPGYKQVTLHGMKPAVSATSFAVLGPVWDRSSSGRDLFRAHIAGISMGDIVVGHPTSQVTDGIRQRDRYGFRIIRGQIRPVSSLATSEEISLAA